MKIVGIIGPYFNGGERRLIDHSIADARFVCTRIANYFGESRLVGFFVPHTHTALFECIAGAPRTYYHALDEIIYNRTCDAFILLPDWDTSSNSKCDYDRAKKQGKTIFELRGFDTYSINTLIKQLDDWADSPPVEEPKQEEKKKKKRKKKKEKSGVDYDSKYRFFFDVGFKFSNSMDMLPKKVREVADALNSKVATLHEAVTRIQTATADRVVVRDGQIVIEVKDGEEVIQRFPVISFKQTKSPR